MYGQPLAVLAQARVAGRERVVPAAGELVVDVCLQRPGPHAHARVAPQHVAVGRLVDEVEDLAAHRREHIGLQLLVLEPDSGWPA